MAPNEKPKQRKRRTVAAPDPLEAFLREIAKEELLILCADQLTGLD